MVPGFVTSYSPNRTTVLAPLKFSGVIDRLTRFEEISVTMTAANGRRYEASWPGSTDEVRAQKISAFLQGPALDGNAFLNLQFFNGAVVKALLAGPVTLTGRLLAQSNRPGPPTQLPISPRTNAEGVGHCSLNSQQDPRAIEPTQHANCRM